MNEKLIEEIMSGLDNMIEITPYWRPLFIKLFQKHLKDKLVIDKKVIDEIIETMSTSKAILKTKGSIPYSNWYADWYKEALQSLIDNNQDE